MEVRLSKPTRGSCSVCGVWSVGLRCCLDIQDEKLAKKNKGARRLAAAERSDWLSSRLPTSPKPLFSRRCRQYELPGRQVHPRGRVAEARIVCPSCSFAKHGAAHCSGSLTAYFLPRAYCRSCFVANGCIMAHKMVHFGVGERRKKFNRAAPRDRNRKKGGCQSRCNSNSDADERKPWAGIYFCGEGCTPPASLVNGRNKERTRLLTPR